MIIQSGEQMKRGRGEKCASEFLMKNWCFHNFVSKLHSQLFPSSLQKQKYKTKISKKVRSLQQKNI